MKETILKLAFASLPKILQEDLFFQNLCNNIDIDYVLLKKITIKDSFYHTLLKIEPQLNQYFTISTSKYELLNMTLFYYNKLICFNITKENNVYKIKIKITNSQKINIIEFIKKETESIVKIIIQKLQHGLITNYESNIYYYDEHYHKKNNPDKAKEILKDFSNLFCIPEEFALFFYQNFKKYKLELNRQKILSECELDRLTRPQKEEYHFTNPIILNSLDKIFSITFPEFQKVDIINALKKNIVEPNVIFSKPLFEDILKYYAGVNMGIIDSFGIIIGKDLENYSKYQLWIKSDKIEISREQISKKCAQELFYLSEDNIDNDYLKDFFGISRSK